MKKTLLAVATVVLVLMSVYAQGGRFGVLPKSASRSQAHAHQ